MRNRLTVTSVPPAQIEIPTFESFDGKIVELASRQGRTDSVADGLLSRSIRQTGIQQPLVVLSDGEKLILVDGLRRLTEAKAQGIPKVPVVIDMLPAGEDALHYVRRLRFILDEHRQDLLPTQKGALIAELKRVRGFTNKDLARFLGCDEDSIYNWLAVLKYIEPVKQAMDVGALPMRAARVFDGMTSEGQEHVWTRHSKALMTQGGRAEIHKKIRAVFPPEKYPQFFRSVKAVQQRMANGARARKSPTALEEEKLQREMAEKQTELADLESEIAVHKKDIGASVPIVSALLRDKKLRALIPESMIEELERFADEYC